MTRVTPRPACQGRPTASPRRALRDRRGARSRRRRPREICEALPTADAERRRESGPHHRRRAPPGRAGRLEKRLESPACRAGRRVQALSEVRDELGGPRRRSRGRRRARDLMPRKLDFGGAWRRCSTAWAGGRGHDRAQRAGALAPSDPRFTSSWWRRVPHWPARRCARRADRAIIKFGGNAAALGQLADLAARWSEGRAPSRRGQAATPLAARREAILVSVSAVQNHKKDRQFTLAGAARRKSSRAEGGARLATS